MKCGVVIVLGCGAVRCWSEDVGISRLGLRWEVCGVLIRLEEGAEWARLWCAA